MSDADYVPVVLSPTREIGHVAVSLINGRLCRWDGAAWTEHDVVAVDDHLVSTDNPHAVTAAQVGAVPTSRTVTAGTGLDGGGDLTTNRTLSVEFGMVAGTVAQGDDSRLSDARTPIAHTHPVADLSDASANGRSLISAADYAAMRSAMGLGSLALIADAPSNGSSYGRKDGAWEVIAGGGDFVGPGVATDNAVVRFDSTTGKLGQNSAVTIDDSGNIATAGTVDGRDVSADGTTLTNHVANTSNPHSVTAAQVGASAVGHTHVAANVTDLGALATLATVGTSQIDADSVTYAKIQNVSATDKLLGRSTAGAGDVEEIACTAAGRALIDDADAAAQRTTLGLGTLATIADAASNGNTYGRKDGAWALIAGGGDVVGPASSTDNAIARFDLATGKLLQNSVVTVDDSGNIVTAGTVDGRDVSVDGAKLDGIAAGATVYTDEQAQDAIGAMLLDTATIDLAYVDGTPSLSASVIDGSITLAKQANMATASVVYRKTAGAGAPEVNTLATLKTDLALVKGDVGLSSVDNTSDAGKPVSTAQQTALDLKSNLASPTFTGTPAAPTAAVDTNTTQLATTAFVNAQGATQAQQEAATSTLAHVTPAVQHFHPSAAKFWVKAGVTGNILGSYNVASLTDTGTGVMAITIATDFSSANYACVVSVEATATTYAVAAARNCHIRSATPAVGSISVDCIDKTATTNLVKDPTSWHVIGFGDHA